MTLVNCLARTAQRTFFTSSPLVPVVMRGHRSVDMRACPLAHFRVYVTGTDTVANNNARMHNNASLFNSLRQTMGHSHPICNLPCTGQVQRTDAVYVGKLEAVVAIMGSWLAEVPDTREGLSWRFYHAFCASSARAAVNGGILLLLGLQMQVPPQCFGSCHLMFFVFGFSSPCTDRFRMPVGLQTAAARSLAW